MLLDRLRWNGWVVAIVAFSLGGLGAGLLARPADVGMPGSTVAESPDFATLALRDPWDMEQYSDVSQYLNDSGQQMAVSGSAVADGLFTGQSIGDINSGNTARFYPLFPGYRGSMEIGKVGHRVANAVGGGGSFHQVFDWMRLTAVDHVQHGTPFPIDLSINRDVSQLTYYYTTDRTDPTQAQALPFSAPPLTGPFFIFLHFLSHNAVANPAGLPVTTNSFVWDTTGVVSNTYYICVAATGGGNPVAYCSEAPVTVD